MLFKRNLMFGLFLFATTPCLSEKNERPGVVKRRYVHTCPVGTEQVGDGPKKSSIVFCRKHLPNGYRLEGDFVTFYKNGNKKAEGEYFLGKKNGVWQNYKHNGEVVSSVEYKDGKIKKKEQDKNHARHRNEPQITSNRPFPEDGEAFTKLYETKSRNKGRASNQKIIYGISPK